MRGSRNFFQGGDQARRPEKSLDVLFFFVFLFYSLQRGFQWFYYREKYNFPRIQHFPGGGPTFTGGVQLFPGGGPDANFYRNPYSL